MNKILQLSDAANNGDMVAAAAKSSMGDVFREVSRVLADGRVTPNERRKVANQVAEAISALCAVMKVL